MYIVPLWTSYNIAIPLNLKMCVISYLFWFDSGSVCRRRRCFDLHAFSSQYLCVLEFIFINAFRTSVVQCSLTVRACANWYTEPCGLERGMFGQKVGDACWTRSRLGAFSCHAHQPWPWADDVDHLMNFSNVQRHWHVTFSSQVESKDFLGFNILFLLLGI